MYFIAMILTCIAIALVLSGLWWAALPVALLVLWMMS